MTAGGDSGGERPPEGIRPQTGTASGTIRWTGTARGGSRPRVQLSGLLFTSGQRFLDAALTAYGNDEHDVFALHAGVAIEHLMKARLAAINPMLILDTDRKPKPEVLIWLADASKHDQRPPDPLRTVGGERAAELLSAAHVGLGAYQDALAKLRQQRNGIGHFGSADLATIVDDLPMILRAAELLATGLTDDPRDVFGRQREFASSQLDEWAEEVGRVLAGRYAVARQRLAEREPPLTGALFAATERAITEAHNANPHRTLSDQLAPCPVCHLPARLDGRLWATYEGIYSERTGDQIDIVPMGEYDAERLSCSTCGLVLDGDLLDASGALENWEVPHEDVEREADNHAAAIWEMYGDDR